MVGEGTRSLGASGSVLAHAGLFVLFAAVALGVYGPALTGAFVSDDFVTFTIPTKGFSTYTVPVFALR